MDDCWNTTKEIPFDKLILFGNPEDGIEMGQRISSDPDVIYTHAGTWSINEIQFWIEIPNFPKENS